MSRRGALLLVWLCCAGARAAEITPTVADETLGVAVSALQMPAEFDRELTSGLTHRLYIRSTLLDATTILQRRTTEIAIRYDLWDQQFIVVTTMDNVVVDTRRLTTVADVNASLAPLRLARLFRTDSLPGTRPLTVRTELLLNPIEREKLDRIRKWVAQNSVPTTGREQGASVSGAIFNRLFEQYADGSDIAAVWRVDVTSVPFRLDSLPHERR